MSVALFDAHFQLVKKLDHAVTPLFALSKQKLNTRNRRTLENTGLLYKLNITLNWVVFWFVHHLEFKTTEPFSRTSRWWPRPFEHSSINADAESHCVESEEMSKRQLVVVNGKPLSSMFNLIQI